MQCCVDCFVQFNHLIDAILAVKDTRAMYLRRLRSLMDDFLAAGASALSLPIEREPETGAQLSGQRPRETVTVSAPPRRTQPTTRCSTAAKKSRLNVANVWHGATKNGP